MIAIIDERMRPSDRSELEKRFEVVSLPPFSKLDKRVASHPDMLVFPVKDKMYVSKEYFNEAEKVFSDILDKTNLELCITNDKIGSEYPHDIAFNCFLSGKTLYGNIKHVSAEIITYSSTVCNLNQGYAKCASVVLGDRGIITADTGIYKAFTANNSHALLVSPGGVILNGYDTGFIGGASGVCNKEVFFTGNILTHKDGIRIKEFCNNLGYKVTSLSTAPLHDVGTIFFI